MNKPKALFICGSLNQTTMMHTISKRLSHFEPFFTPYYTGGLLQYLADRGFLESTILGKNLRKKVEDYLIQNRLNVDAEGKTNEYNVVFTFSDLAAPKNLKNNNIMIV